MTKKTIARYNKSQREGRSRRCSIHRRLVLVWVLYQCSSPLENCCTTNNNSDICVDAFTILSPLDQRSRIRVNDNTAGTKVDPSPLNLVHTILRSTGEGEVEQSTRRDTFHDLGLSKDILNAVSQEWTAPTPIQRLVIPAILQWRAAGTHQKSLWAQAPTGSGKTAAYALPLLQLTIQERRDRLLLKTNMSRSDESSKRGGRVRTLVLVPTRELAVQISSVFCGLNEGLPFNRKVETICVHGGVPIEEQVEALASRYKSGRGVDILVCTPGRLVDVLRRYEGDTNDDDVNNGEKKSTEDVVLEKKLLAALDATGRIDASLTLSQIQELKLEQEDALDDGRKGIVCILDSVRYLVLDEADRLLGQAFKNEMDEVVKLLLLNNSRTDSSSTGVGDVGKTLLFSATFPDHMQPRVERMLQRLQRGTINVPLRLTCSNAGMTEHTSNNVMEELSSRKKKRLQQATQPSAILEGPASTIDLRTIRISERDRTQALRRLLLKEEEWDRVLVFVSTRYSAEHVAKKLRRANVSTSELHGKLDQEARIRRLNDFRRGNIRVLVATDLASRGLDVPNLSAVINYDLPRSTADFVHRIGRTGRAGKRGTAVTFITPSNEAQFDLIEKRHVEGSSSTGVEKEREVIKGFEVDEIVWAVQRDAAARMAASGAQHSKEGLVHDQMFGGVKGRRKSKKDKLREATASTERKEG